ncbi:Eco57I restriction-modification methylase domain-containing protein [Rhodococcus sp. BP22]|uniref:Eco57I restriction-modification methylase domain-containing protein n=1 Tax=Rhodococcus sp. BP22 TaxID=2758566 RepID=UPI001648AF7F|nr:DNA methyltransferase [Rhodococcus sp. BP22]
MSGESFVGVRIQGGLLPADLPSQLGAGRDPSGNTLSPKDYHLAAGETVRDAGNRVWAYLRGAWASYQDALEQIPEGSPTTALTRERFLLVLLDQLGYGRVPTTGKGGIEVGGQHFSVSHLWGATPVHLLGARTELDSRTKGLAGAAGSSPQSMVQELLNRSDQHLWAILSNGQVLRLLRDSTSLVGSAYVEFDLEAIFDGDLFADFMLLYTLCQVSRVEVRDDELGPSSCRLEQWRTEAVEAGSRALNLLRDGVVEALRTLGTGFLTDAANSALRDDLSAGRISVADVNHALLRVVYRLLFTFVAEDRGALLDPSATTEARQRYLDYFSTARLRRTALRRRGGRYGDRWQALTLVWRGLGSEDGRPELGLPGIGGLYEAGELDFLTDCALSNAALMSAVRSLSLVREPKSGVLRVVDYRNLGAEELGSIYEALLEFVPQWDPATKVYTLDIASGNQRKDTGSYYTPTSLVESLLDTALDPILDDAVKTASDADGQERALLKVTVCDPACGSGHFLVGAARRIAKRVAAIRTGDPEPAPAQVRSAMRDVVANCVYGVDVNELAAELAKVSLWMEALEPGRPLAYLDAQIKVGNALIGATPAVLADGVPDAAFKAIEGDEKTVATETTRANKAERRDQGSLFDLGESIAANTGLARQLQKVIGVDAVSLSDVHVQRQRMRAYSDSMEYQQARLTADAWCAAFVWPLKFGAPNPLTESVVAGLASGTAVLDDQQAEELSRLTAEYRFFHWHLEFPHLFPTVAEAGDTINEATGWAGGFSVVLGNPPWERVKLQEQEFFAARDPQIATAPNAAARKQLIDKLPNTNPALYRTFTAEKRRAEGISHLLRNSGRYPLTGRGDINTYAVFAEADQNLLSGDGRLGVILPTGIATDATTQYFFKDLVEHGAIASLYDFENRKPLFEAVDSRFKFCLLTLAGRHSREPRADFAFFAHDPTDLLKPDTRFTLSPEEILLLNPNTGTCPVFRSRRDAEITLAIYRRVPILIREGDPKGNPWGIKFMTMFHMSNDSHLFHTRKELETGGWTLNGNVFEKERGSQLDRMLPLYEAKMLAAYDHRAADVIKSKTAEKRQNQPRYLTIGEHADPRRSPLPLAWVRAKELPSLGTEWLTGFSDVTSPTNERTMISAVLPCVGVGHTYPLYFTQNPIDRALLLAAFNSFCFDYCARQKVAGLHLTYTYLRQIPVPHPTLLRKPSRWTGAESVSNWIQRRVLHLSYTGLDLQSFALDLGTDTEPVIWEPEVREILQRELDAAFFHLYGIERDDVDYIMDTFPIVKRKDEAAFGEYRTKRLILEYYDAMSAIVVESRL